MDSQNEIEDLESMVSKLTVNQAVNSSAKSLKSKMLIVDQRFRQHIVNLTVDYFKQDQINILVDVVRTGNIIQKHQAIVGLRLMSSRCIYSPLYLKMIQKYIEAELIEILVEGIQQNDYPQIRMESIWILVNIASSQQKKHIQTIIKSGAFTHVKQIFFTTSDEILIENILWLLGNTISTSAQERDFIIVMNFTERIIHILNNFQNIKLIRLSLWVFHGMIVTKPFASYFNMNQITNILCKIIKSGILEKENNQQMKSDCIWALGRYCIETLQCSFIQQHNLIPKMLSYLHNSQDILFPTLLIVQSLCQSQQLHTKLIYSGLINAIIPLLNHSLRSIRKESCLSLFYLCQNSINVANFLAENSNIKTKIVEIYCKDHVSVYMCATFFLNELIEKADSNLTRDIIFEMKIIEKVFRHIEQNSSNFGLIENQLILLRNILISGEKFKEINQGNICVKKLNEIYGGFQYLAELQNHHNIQVCKKSEAIINFLNDGQI